jgi:hypothetical protein
VTAVDSLLTEALRDRYMIERESSGQHQGGKPKSPCQSLSHTTADKLALAWATFTQFSPILPVTEKSIPG